MPAAFSPAASAARPRAVGPNVLFAVLVAAAVALVWAERSRYLVSWDAGNFALALSGIDIAAHKPHPPGYVGYVLAGRLLNPLVSSANDGFVLWNIIATILTAVTVSRLAAVATGGSRRVIAAGALLCSPLLLFYACSAEIYSSELAAVVLIVVTARGVIAGTVHPVLLIAAFVLGALFKLSSALFMLPVVAYALSTAPLTPQRRRAAYALTAGGVAVVAAVFLWLQPGLVSIVWQYFLDATSRSRVIGTATTDFGRAFNRNVRDTLIALLAAAGVNMIGVIGWLVRSRKAPLDRRLLWLWVLPWCVVLPFVHIGKPGYVLPIFPVFVLIAADWYASLGKRGSLLAAGASIANVVWFVFAPPSPVASDTRPYREKPLLSRMASDLAPLTFPTVNTLRQNDREVADFVTQAASCQSGAWVVVAGSYRADWRRAMYYLPNATAVRQTDEGTFQFIGRNGTFSEIGGAEPLSSACGLLWTSPTAPSLQTNATPVPVVSGWRIAPGSGSVSPSELRWTVR